MIFLLDPAKDPLSMVKKLKQDRDEQSVGGSMSIVSLSVGLEEVILKTVDLAVKVNH